jgi:hypothetical protein
MMKRLTAFLTILLFGGLAVASAQSLAEMAKKEKERREKNNSTQTKSFSDRDLADFRDTTLVVSTPVDTADEETPVPTEATELDEEEGAEEDPTRTETYWRDRLAPLNRRIAELQAQINRPGFAEDPANMMQRQRLERDLEQAQRECDTVVRQARRQGVPPGWLR